MAKLITFFVLAFIMIVLLIIYSMKKKKVLLIPFSVLVLFLIYSLLTTDGAVRIEAASKGHPLKAYSSKVTEINTMRTDEFKVYTTSKDIPGTSNLIKCYDVAFMKYCNYHKD